MNNDPKKAIFDLDTHLTELENKIKKQDNHIDILICRERALKAQINELKEFINKLNAVQQKQFKFNILFDTFNTYQATHSSNY